MSSGWDSSSILAVLAKQNGTKNLRPIIGRVRYSKKYGIVNSFEVERARKIADYYSLPLEVIDIDYSGNKYLDYITTVKDNLKNNHIYMPFNYFYMKIAEYVGENGSEQDAVFNGEISDGAHNLGFSQFATILEHQDLNFREYSDKMASYLFSPSFFKLILKNDYKNDFVYQSLVSRTNQNFIDTSNKSLSDIKRMFVESFFISNQRIPFYDFSKNRLMSEKGYEEYRNIVYEKYLRECAEEIIPETIYSWILHLYNSFHWQGGTVKGITNALDYHDRKISMPFWDKRIQNF